MTLASAVGNLHWLIELIVVYTAAFVAILFVACSGGSYFAGRLRLAESVAPLVGIIPVSLAAFGLVWIYFLNYRVGRVAAVVGVLGAVFLSARFARHWTRREPLVWLLAIGYCIGLFYLGILYLPGAPEVNASQRFFALRPIDNQLPGIFADHLYFGSNLKALIGDWHGSDRPPLQSGLLLGVRPFVDAIAPASLIYECTGVVAQLTALLAAWSLTGLVTLNAARRGLVLGLCIFSGFFLYNSTYVWPKLLAAALSVSFAVLFLEGTKRKHGSMIVLSSAAAACAMLAHGGVAFFILPVALGTLWLTQYRRVGVLATAFVVGVAIMLPWSVYTRFYDPPGDRLLKMHLAGLVNVDPRSAAAALSDQYRTTPVATIVNNRVDNLRTAIFGARIGVNASNEEPDTPLNKIRIIEREFIIPSLAVVNVGWLSFLWSLLSPTSRLQRNMRFCAALILSALASIVFWSLVTWGPGETVITHSAYAVDLVLYVALGISISGLPLAWGFSILALQIIDFLLVWVVGTAGDAARINAGINPSALAVTVLSVVLIALLLFRGPAADESVTRG